MKKECLAALAALLSAVSAQAGLGSSPYVAFDLPTEAQWEYACRAGTTTSLNNGADLYSTGQDDEMQKVGRYCYNRGDKKGGFSDHTKVGSYVPNAWGLYDMLGNVQEWCLDLHGDYGTGAQTDPAGASSGPRRVCRGGSYHSTAGGCRSAARNRNIPSVESSFVGFRAVVLLPEGE